MGNYIRFDWAIKRLLRNKADFDVVNGFLSCLLGKQIYITKVLESEGNKRTIGDKINRVDILVEDETGEKIKKIYSINIVYFKFGDGKDYVYHGYTEFRGIHTGDILELTKGQQKRLKRENVSDIYPEYYVLRVENFDDTVKTPLDEWIFFLKNTSVPEKFTAQGLKEVREKLRIENLSEEEKCEYYDHLKNMNYAASAMEASHLAGIEIGIDKERAKNKIKEEKIVLNSHNAGLSIDTIATITGLTTEQVIEILKQYKNNNNE